MPLYRRLPKYVGRPMGPGHTKTVYGVVKLDKLNSLPEGSVVDYASLRSLRGGRAIGRVSTPPTPSATTAAPARVRRLHLRLRLRGLRPERAAAAAPDGKDCIGIASHASDADCDDGGPGSEFQQADCPYGSDCGPRMPTHAARRHPRSPALATAFSFVGTDVNC